MMRYQRVSPDYLPFSNGKKSNLRTTCKEDGENNSSSKTISNNGFDSNFEAPPKGFRFRSPSKSHDTNNHHHNHNHSNGGALPSTPSLSDNNNNNQSQRVDTSPSRRGDVLLQWGQKKRARLSRTEIRSLTDDSSSFSSIQARQSMKKIQRRGPGLMDKLSTATIMASSPPPPPLPQPANGSSTTSRASNLRSKEPSGLINNSRNVEDRSPAAVAVNGSPSRHVATGNTRAVSRSTAGKPSSSSPSPPDKIDSNKKMMSSRKDDKVNGGSVTKTDHHHHHQSSNLADSTTRLRPEQQEAAVATAAATNNTNSIGEKGSNVEVMEWPKIYVALSRKEKEDDFLAMKGTKLPHRPKKRAKNIERALQYCFPGMWLSDLTKSRYEVREKKSVKKQKRRGLKGMESMDSDSE